MDADEAGFKAADFFKLFGYKTLFVPERAQNTGIKDFAEFVQKYGIDVFEKYLKHVNLL